MECWHQQHFKIGIEWYGGPENVTKISGLGHLRNLVWNIVTQNVISQSIFIVRSWFLAQIEAGDKLHPMSISWVENSLPQGALFVSKNMVKSQKQPHSCKSSKMAKGVTWHTFDSLGEIGWVQWAHIIAQFQLLLLVGSNLGFIVLTPSKMAAFSSPLTKRCHQMSKWH